MEINLEKGDAISLEKIAPGLTNIHVGLGWDSNESYGIDCDVSVFMINDNFKIPANGFFVFFNNLNSQDGSVVHLGDNTLGEGDDEVINISLNHVDNQISQMIFVVTIHKAAEKGLHFGMIDNAFIRIENRDSGEKLCRYSLNSQFSGSDSVQIGRVYRYESQWYFEAMGEGYSGGLAAILGVYN
ncbi:MAG: TerD family protein [Cryomorphaceae bacterium]|jgi:tellurium resistance protein TerD|nr:TerD family protein [Cryomorphaceae bacterium]